MVESNGQSRGADNTRNRILDASLTLLNAEGIVKVSINRIAAEIDISPGNLYYHFKTKELIVDWLVRRLQNRVTAITNTTDAVIALDDFWVVVHLTLETLEEYRFVYRDLPHLVCNWPTIAQRVRTITTNLITKTRGMCLDLARVSVIRVEPEELESVTLQMVFTATCWTAFAGVLPRADAQTNQSGRTAYQVLTLLSPYLSKESHLYMKYLRSKYVK